MTRLVVGLLVAIWYLAAGVWLSDDGRARRSLRGDPDHVLEAPSWRDGDPPEVGGRDDSLIPDFGEGESATVPAERTFLFGTNHTGQAMTTLLLLAPGTVTRALGTYLAISLVTMVVVGVVTGVHRGMGGAVLRRVVEANHALPQLIVVFAALSLVGVSFATLAVTLAITSGLAKSMIIRDRVVDLHAHDFFEGLKEMDVPVWRVIVVHILHAHCRPLVLVQVPFLIAELVFFESCIGYLGRPVDVTGVSFGAMLHGAVQQWGRGADWMFWVPALGIVLSLWGWTWLGRALADRLLPEGSTV